MKYLVILSMLCIQSYSLAFIDKVSIAIGSYSQHLGTIEESVGGEENSLEHAIYFSSRAELNWVLFETISMITEVGVTIPRSSKDSAVSEINYWTTLLFSTEQRFFQRLRPHIGLGFLFTRLSMDGTPQQLTNAGASTTFQTPSGPSTAWNNIAILGVDIDLITDLYLSSQLYLTNIEDTVESSKTILFSLNYNLGTP